MALRRLTALLLLLFFVLGISIVGAQAEPLKVVATYSILGDIVQNIAGDNIELTVLVGPDGDSHVYEPTPQDAIALAEADIIFENGLEFETWLDDLYESSGSTATRIVVSDGIEPLAFEEGEHEHEDEHAHEHEHEEVLDLSPWAGEWVTGWSFGIEAMQPAFDAILAAVPELTQENIFNYYEAGNQSAFGGFTVEGDQVTIVDASGTATCAYSFDGSETVVAFPTEMWSLFSTDNEACAAYRYLLLMPPHSPEPGSSPHAHFRYGSTSFEDLIADDSAWYPSIYPAGTTGEQVSNAWITSARMVGLYIASVQGIEVALTEEEQAAEESAPEADHAHEEEHEAITDLTPWNGAWISTRRYSDLPEMQAAYATIAEIVGVSIEEAEAFIHSVERVDFDEVIVADGTVTYLDGDTRLTCAYQLMGEEEAMFVGVPFGTWYQWETEDPDCESYRYVIATPLHSGDFGDVPNFHLRYGSVSFDDLTQSPENATWFATVGPDTLTEAVYVESYTVNAEGWAAFMLAERGDSTMLDAMLAGGDDGHDLEHDHEHGEFDPHIWHDPNNGIVMVENIRAALSEADSANADVYATNAEAYIAELTALDTYIREQVATIPEANRILVTSHDTFGYFADEYGFEVLNVLGSLSTEAADPSAGELAELIGEIQASGVPAIFTENITNPALVEQVASEAGVIVAPTLYTDALGQPGTAGETYLSMLRYNIDTITEALQ